MVAQSGFPAVVRVAHDLAYTLDRHTRGGKQVLRDLARGREVHIFNEDVDLDELERKVWTEGKFLGAIGTGQRGLFERFVWGSPIPIGRRIEKGQEDVSLSWVEIKGKMVGGAWVYHLVPRSRPAT